MKGGVYTYEHCPVCGEKFTRTGDDLLCLHHQTRPRRYYIQIYDKDSHKHVNIFSDSRNVPFASYEQANRILTKMRAEIDAGAFDASRYVAQRIKPLQFINWSSRWLEDRKVEMERRIISPSYLKELKRFVKIFQNYFGSVDIRDINSKRIHEFHMTLKTSPKYTTNILSCLRKMLSDALTWGDIKIMPRFPKIDLPETDFRTIDLDQQDQIINSIQDPMDKAFVLFTARMMVRPSETRALFWEDIDLKHDRITIRRHFSLNELRETTKSKRIKVLPLDSTVKDTLSRLPRHITSPFMFQKSGNAYSESYGRKLWNRVTAEMGIRISFYQGTRHSSATEAVNRTNLDLVRQFLGHTRQAMTQKYARMNPEGLKPVLRKDG